MERCGRRDERRKRKRERPREEMGDGKKRKELRRNEETKGGKEGRAWNYEKRGLNKNEKELGERVWREQHSQRREERVETKTIL